MTSQLDELSNRQGRVNGSVFDLIDFADCWEWTGGTIPKGYGKVWFEGKRWLVHRLIWSVLIGPIKDGLQIDHLCRNKLCCNPDHLEPVTQSQNQSRGFRSSKKIICKRNHYPPNWMTRRSGDRVCKACQSEADNRSYLRKKELASLRERAYRP